MESNERLILRATQVNTANDDWLTPKQDFVLRRDKSVDRYIPLNIQRKLFFIPHSPRGAKARAESKDLSKPQQIGSENQDPEDWNKKMIAEQSKKDFEDILESTLILSERSSNKRGQVQTSDRKLFSYSRKHRDGASSLLDDETNMVNFESSDAKQIRTSVRKVDCTPSKVLDAPGMEDDFYKQVLEWTSRNILIVALQQSVYSWCPETNINAILFTCTSAGDKISAVKATEDGLTLYIGTYSGNLYRVNIPSASCGDRPPEMMASGLGRVASLDVHNKFVAIGCKDKGLVLLDAETRRQTLLLELMSIPESEICGVKFSPNGMHLAAGANDNRFIVIDIKGMNLLINSMEHKAAVRAIAWSYKSACIVASGGGRKDKCINFWNIMTGKLQTKIETESQVCGLSFSKSTDEFISTHGFSNNNIQVWSGQTYQKIAELVGHTHRVLYHALSPNGSTLVTSSADESLRFWNVFPKPELSKVNKTLLQTVLHLR